MKKQNSHQRLQTFEQKNQLREGNQSEFGIQPPHNLTVEGISFFNGSYID